MTRWTFVDTVTNETWTMPINPKTASSPFAGKVLTTSQGASLGSTGLARTRVFQGPSEPAMWEFGGQIRTQAHHDALLAWGKKSVPIKITDHLGRAFEVLIQSVKPVEQRARRADQWRMTYTVSCLVLRRVA